MVTEDPNGYVPSPGVRRFRRVLKVLGLVVAVLVAVPVTLYVGHGLVGSVADVRLRAEVREEVRAARAEVQPQVLALRERQRAALPVAPTHSWAALECTFGTSEGGWIVLSHHQNCELRTLDLLAVASEAEAEALSAGLPTDLFGAVADPHRQGSSCRPLRAVGDGSGSGSQVLWVPGATIPDGPEHCHQVSTGRPGATQDAFESFDPAALDPGTDWLVVRNARTVLERRDLGCSPWSVVFCSRPFREPVLG